MNFSNFYEVHCRLCVLIRGLQNLDKLSERKVSKAAQPPIIARSAKNDAADGGERI